MKITMDGVEIPFRDFLIEMGGSGFLYDVDIQDMMSEWREANWARVDDYYGPIAAQVIIDASEIDREIYNEIMQIIEKSYKKLLIKHLTEYEEDAVKERRRSLHVIKKEKPPIPDQEK